MLQLAYLSSNCHQIPDEDTLQEVLLVEVMKNGVFAKINMADAAILHSEKMRHFADRYSICHQI
jgi:hypothetical protein